MNRLADIKLKRGEGDMERTPGKNALAETHKYDDIIHMKYPLECHDTVKYPPMSRTDRAKIFSPFAALKGYEEAIAAKRNKM